MLRGADVTRRWYHSEIRRDHTFSAQGDHYCCLRNSARFYKMERFVKRHWRKPLPRAGFKLETGIAQGRNRAAGRRTAIDLRFSSAKICSMPKTLIESVVKQLRQERARLENELNRVTAALTTFGKVFLEGPKRRSARPGKKSAGPRKNGPRKNGPRKKRTISAAGRRRIAAAQKARWAKVKAAAEK
jgi:hypothetical protein